MMSYLSKFRRVISLLVIISTLMLSYQAFAHAHFEGPDISGHGQAVMVNLDSISYTSDIFSFESAQGSCHIFNHLTVLLDQEHVACEQTVSPLGTLLSATVIGLPYLPPFQPPKH
jgi:hypothetical protein